MPFSGFIETYWVLHFPENLSPQAALSYVKIWFASSFPLSCLFCFQTHALRNENSPFGAWIEAANDCDTVHIFMRIKGFTRHNDAEQKAKVFTIRFHSMCYFFFSLFAIHSPPPLHIWCLRMSCGKSLLLCMCSRASSFRKHKKLFYRSRLGWIHRLPSTHSSLRQLNFIL